MLQCPYFHVFFIIYQQQKEENRYSDSKIGWNVTVLVIDNNSFQIKKKNPKLCWHIHVRTWQGKAFRHSYFTKLWVPSDCRNSNRKCQHEFYNCIKDIQYRPETTCSRMDLLLEVKWLLAHTKRTNEQTGRPNWMEKCRRGEESHQAGTSIYICCILCCAYALCDKHIKFYDIEPFTFYAFEFDFGLHVKCDRLR